jgi:hypothetical protein
MPLTNESHTSKDQDAVGGEDREAVALEKAVRSIPVLAYQDQGGEIHQEAKGFYWQFGQYRGTTDSSGQLRVPFKKEFPEGVASLVTEVTGVSVLGVIAKDKTGFTIGASAQPPTKNAEILVNFMAIGF